MAEFEFEQGIRMQNVKRRGPGEDGENVYQRMVKSGVNGGMSVSGPPESLKHYNYGVASERPKSVVRQIRDNYNHFEDLRSYKR